MRSFSLSSELSNASLRLIAQHSQVKPTVKPTLKPTLEPTIEPTVEPTVEPTGKPIVETTVDILRYTIRADRNRLDDIHSSIHDQADCNRFDDDDNGYTIQADCKFPSSHASKHS
jgi:hypothetical protein